jgi:hypothetical protein
MLSGTVLLIPKKAFEAVFRRAADRRDPPGNTPPLVESLVIKLLSERAGTFLAGTGDRRRPSATAVDLVFGLRRRACLGH